MLNGWLLIVRIPKNLWEIKVLSPLVGLAIRFEKRNVCHKNYASEFLALMKSSFVLNLMLLLIRSIVIFWAFIHVNTKVTIGTLWKRFNVTFCRFVSSITQKIKAINLKINEDLSSNFKARSTKQPENSFPHKFTRKCETFHSVFISSSSTGNVSTKSVIDLQDKSFENQPDPNIYQIHFIGILLLLVFH